MNTEIVVALIGMAATAWAPTVTAYVSRSKELKLKKLEIYQMVFTLFTWASELHIWRA